MHATTPEYSALMQEYVRVSNAALEAHKDCYPYMRVIEEIADRLKAHAVRIAVYEEDENHPEAFFKLVLRDKSMKVEPCAKPRVKQPLLLSRYYLEQVAKQPDTYINNPAQLNWVWLNDHSIG